MVAKIQLRQVPCDAYGHSVNSKYYLHREEVKTELAVSNMEKDLGMCVSDDLKWSNQCSKSAAKAMSVLGMIRRTFPYLDNEGFTPHYNTYMRLYLKHCVQVWAPYNARAINCLERVQMRATRLVSGLKHLSYEERLERMGLFSLEHRRKGVTLSRYIRLC